MLLISFEMNVPSGVRRIARKLGLPAEEETDFLEALCAGSEVPVSVSFGEPELPSEKLSNISPAPGCPPFQPSWIQRNSTNGDETDYQLDLSSVFLLAPLMYFDGHREKPHVLDMCASPGGKTILAARALSPGLSAANEVIQKRIPALISNLKRCRIRNAKVFSRDPSFYELAAKEAFDICIADVPCSGQSLYGSGGVKSGAFHETQVRKNALRQRRILASAAVTVCRGGLLLYSTCTFSREENEAVIEWFLRVNSDFTAVEIPRLSDFRSRITEQPAYRLFPHQGHGRGGFSALLRRNGLEARENQSLQAIWQQL